MKPTSFSSSSPFYSSCNSGSSEDEGLSLRDGGNEEEHGLPNNTDSETRCATSESTVENHMIPLTLNSAEIISRIEALIMDTLTGLSSQNGQQRPRLPRLVYRNNTGHPTTKDFANTSQSRSICNVFLILQLVYGLLLNSSIEKSGELRSKGLNSHRSTITTRQIYYYYVTHFKNQKECDDSISDVCKLLRVPRIALGIVASPKGWLCGALQIQCSSNFSTNSLTNVDNMTILDGIGALNMSDGLPISSHWIDYLHTLANNKTLAGTPTTLPVFSLVHHPIIGPAKMIVVIEKETVYHRLVEELNSGSSTNILQTCIFITGKGYPDVATRACLSSISQTFPDLPVVGFCDCNPFGVHVLHTYLSGGSIDTLNWEERDLLATPRLDWIGLFPSQLSSLREKLPRNAFQQMTARDLTKLNSLLEIFDEVADDENSHEDFNSRHTILVQELHIMLQQGYKAELEALHWLGMDYLIDWMKETLSKYLSEWERKTFDRV